MFEYVTIAWVISGLISVTWVAFRDRSYLPNLIVFFALFICGPVALVLLLMSLTTDRWGKD